MGTYGYISRMLLASCLFVGFVVFFLKETPVTTTNGGEAIGGGMGLILIPALVVVPWRLKHPLILYDGKSLSDHTRLL